jgi:hypothetical protein
MQSTATNYASAESSLIRINPPRRKASWGESSSAVNSTLHGDRMNNCHDVMEIYADCLKTHSPAQICKTAASYYHVCMTFERDI